MSITELLPLGQSIPPQVLKENYVKVEDKPFGQSALAYSIVIQNSWIQLQLSASDPLLRVEHPKLIGNYLSPKDQGGNAMVQVWCQGLIREIAAADWLRDFLALGNASILSLEARSPYLADALIVRQDGPILLQVRISAHLAGNRLFLIHGTAPADLFDRYAESFGIAVSSFKPCLITDNPHVELWQTHNLDNALSFNAPYSWLERRPQAPAGLDMVHLFNLNARVQLIANLKVMSVRRSLTKGKKHIDLHALVASEFMKAGLRVTELASEESVKVDAPLSNASFKIWKAVLPKAKPQRAENMLVVAVNTPNHHVVAGLQTGAPSEGFYEYAVHRRAFDIVLGSLECRVQPEPAVSKPRTAEESTVGRRQ